MQKLLLCVALCISLVAGVDLSGKTRYWPQGLTSAFNLVNVIVPPSYSYVTQTDQSPCRSDACTVSIQTVYAITYQGQGTSYACFCNNADMNISYMADNIGRVPQPIRAKVVGYTAATIGVGQGADTDWPGYTIAFFDQNENTEVFIHESAHAYDRGPLSSSSAWYSAETADTCIPDGYAGSNDVENFAQMVVSFTYLVLTGTAYPSCMTNQLNYVNSVLSSSSIVGTTQTTHSSAVTAGYFNSCYNIGYNTATYVLSATCYQISGATVAASINLNNCLTNSNGVLGPMCNGNFAGSCTNVAVSGTAAWGGPTTFRAGELLRATCYPFSGAVDTDEYNLDFISNNNGVLSCGC